MDVPDKGKAFDRFEVHLQLMVPTEPDTVWEYLRPPDARATNWVKNLRSWADSVHEAEGPRRPVKKKSLRQMRSAYLTYLDDYEVLCDEDTSFPYSIYTKWQVKAARNLIRAALARPTPKIDQDVETVCGLLANYAFKQSVEVTAASIAGHYRKIPTRALIYWCLHQIAEE